MHDESDGRHWRIENEGASPRTWCDDRSREELAARGCRAMGDDRQMFFLANSPHPILDGVDAAVIIKSNRTASNDESNRDLPVTRTYYPTDSEFIHPERNTCFKASK